MLTELDDASLIRRYTQDQDQQAFETLLRRHYDLTYNRFIKHLGNPDDAADLAQQLWLRVSDNLASYRDEGKFPSFLMRIASNLLTDFWRRKGIRDKTLRDTANPEEFEQIDTDSGCAIKQLSEQEQVNHLTHTLIPALPSEQRMAFLLKHESEFWDPNHRLDWDTLATLNATTPESAAERFETCRNTLLQAMYGPDKPEPPSGDDLVLFMIWTQAQRNDKRKHFTWDYYADVLNISANTFKTRYRSALKSLSAGLKEYTDT